MNSIIKFFFLLLAVSFLFSCGGSTETIDQTVKQDIPTELATINAKISIDAGNASLYAQRAEYYFTKKQIALAIEDLNRAIKLDPQNANYYVRLSDYHFVKNETRQTRDLLYMAIRINPNNNDALLKLGELFYLVKKYDSAVYFINTSIKAQPDNAKAYFQKAMALKELGDTISAVKAFQTCIETDPNYYDAHLILANLYAIKKNKFALEYYQNAIKLKPNNIDGLYGLGLFYQNTNDINNANAIYDQILKIDSNHVYTMYNKGYINIVVLNKPKDAFPYFNRALQLNPDYANAIYMRGLCYEKMGDKKLAAADYNATIITEPSHQLALEGLKRLSKK